MSSTISSGCRFSWRTSLGTNARRFRRQRQRGGRTLYQRLLREDFEKLPPTLRRFHACLKGGSGKGVFLVTNGKGISRRLMARLWSVPGGCANVPVRLEVIANGSKEVWIRRFGDRVRRTVQWQQDDCLIEKAGPLEFAFRVRGDSAGMQYRSVRCRFLKLPLPGFLAPRVEAEVKGFPDCWKVEVKISSPLLGPVASYTGSVTPSL